jgi:hypothetical protein
MSGEGALAAAVQFDRRPGDLEATRGAVLRQAQDGRDARAAFMVWGERGPDGWQVRIKCDRALSAEDAFALSAEICRIGELIEGRATF